MDDNKTLFNEEFTGRVQNIAGNFIPYPADLLVTGLILAAVTIIGLLFLHLGFTESNIITVYLLGVLLTSLFTRGYACSVISSVLSVVLFNYFMTFPRLTFHAYGAGYPITFAIMLAASIITGTLASKLKDHAKLSAQSAFRTRVLFDTNRLLQLAQDDNDIINITANQLQKLLSRDIITYSEIDGSLSKGCLFAVDQEMENRALIPDQDLYGVRSRGKSEETAMDYASYFDPREKEAVVWVHDNRVRAGATTSVYPDLRCLYLPIVMNNMVYGVIGIDIGGKALDFFEDSVVMSIIGECALAIENSRNREEKEKAAVLAKNEQLRANLLRTISHDLRTPLTSISGNAANLLSNFDRLDDESRKQIFADIYDDSQWLINVVENLLSITRLEEGRLHFDMSLHLIDEVIEEALRHINNRDKSHKISVEYKEDLLLARMDAKLIIQVIINLLDNAMKHTDPGTDIKIIAGKEGDHTWVSIADQGPGVPDDMKTEVFEMFYTGNNRIADCRRSLGLGLFLCKSIIEAHSGTITLTDNEPHGAIFTFTLPSGEVDLSE